VRAGFPRPPACGPRETLVTFQCDFQKIRFSDFLESESSRKRYQEIFAAISQCFRRYTTKYAGALRSDNTSNPSPCKSGFLRSMSTIGVYRAARSKGLYRTNEAADSEPSDNLSRSF
jgi:hypothetical protein